MHRKISLFLFLICYFQHCYSAEKPLPYKLSICTFFYNEASCLKEWIEFHRLVGVDHFYLYNNNSNDNYLEILAPYITEGIVEVTDWPSNPEKNWTAQQTFANNHCLKKCLYETAWVAFIDTDEYVLPLDKQTIPEFLEEYKQYGGVYVFWQNYGTSSLLKLPEDGLLTEHLTWKYRWDHPKNFQGKSIVQPKHVKYFWIHFADFKKKYYVVTESKKRKIYTKPEIDRIRINHYWTRTEDFFYEIKIPRLERSTRIKLSSEEIDTILTESNEVQDRVIFQWIPELKKRI